MVIDKHIKKLNRIAAGFYKEETRLRNAGKSKGADLANADAKTMDETIEAMWALKRIVQAHASLSHFDYLEDADGGR